MVIRNVRFGLSLAMVLPFPCRVFLYRFFPFLLLIICLFSPTAAFSASTTYYVDASTGNDEADGKSPATAWKTIAQVDKVDNSMGFRPGDVIKFKRGERWNRRIRIDSGGRPGKHITLGAYGEGERPIIDGAGVAETVPTLEINAPWLIIEDLSITNTEFKDAVVASGLADHFTMRRCSVHGNKKNGVVIRRISNVVLTQNEIQRNALDDQGSWSGITVDTYPSLPIENIEISHNRVMLNHGGAIPESNSANGIQIGNSKDPVINNLNVVGNKIYKNGNTEQRKLGRGISATFCGNATFADNFIYSSASAGLFLKQGKDCGSLNVKITRNVFYDNPKTQLGGRIYAPSTIEVQDNLFVARRGSSSSGKGFTGSGTAHWSLKNNLFFIASEDSGYDGAIVRHQDTSNLKSDNNLFFVADALRFRNQVGSSVYNALNFGEWQQLGYDKHSTVNDPTAIETTLKTIPDSLTGDKSVADVWNAIDIDGLRGGSRYQRALLGK